MDITLIVSALSLVATIVSYVLYNMAGQANEYNKRVNEIIDETIKNANKQEPKTKVKRKLPHNCVNCGALLNGDVCEYCGTKYN